MKSIIEKAEQSAISADRMSDIDVISISLARELIKEAYVNGLKESYQTLWVIANMQIQENTDKTEALELCISLAKMDIELIERKMGGQ